MSTLATLLKALDSSEVEFAEIGELLQGVSNVRWTDAADSRYRYIDLSSVDRITHGIRDTTAIDSATAPSRAQQIVLAGDVLFGTTRPMLKRYCLVPRQYDGQICSTGFCVLRPKGDKLLPSFLFHVLGTEAFYSYVGAHQQGAGYPSISDRSVKRFRIPILSIDIQRAIVEVLDSYRELEAALEAALEAELDSRRQQYHHYRDALLDFTEPGAAAASKQARVAPWKTLSEVGALSRGRRFTNQDFVPSGIGCIHYGEVYTHYGLAADTTRSFVRPELAAKLRMANKGDLVIAGTGENVEEIGKAVAWLGETPVAVHDDCYIFSHTLNPKYIAHFFRSGQFHAQKARFAAGAKMIRITSDDLGRIRIPVPPDDEQRHIVAILDTFDALVNDLSIGLPAELEARRQQYEYYRDRLLTFREAA